MLILVVLTMVQYVYLLLLILMINDDYGGARLVAATRLNLYIILFYLTEV